MSENLFLGKTIENINSAGKVNINGVGKVETKNLLNDSIPKNTTVLVVKKNEKYYIYSCKD